MLWRRSCRRLYCTFKPRLDVRVVAVATAVFGTCKGVALEWSPGLLSGHGTVPPYPTQVGVRLAPRSVPPAASASFRSSDGSASRVLGLGRRTRVITSVSVWVARHWVCQTYFLGGRPQSHLVTNVCNRASGSCLSVAVVGGYRAVRVVHDQRVGDKVVTDCARIGAQRQALVGGFCAVRTAPTGRPLRCKSRPCASPVHG